MYKPVEMKNTYDKMEHGKAKMAAIRAAAAEADRQGDVSYQMFFRAEICYESCFYGDAMDLMVVFPELLALADKYPDTPATIFEGFVYVESMEHVLWIYKWVLSHCESFYQIPMEDCMKFFQDARERFLSYGFNLKPWYLTMYEFYKHIDEEKAQKAFHEYEKLPRDSNSDCAACERNVEIEFYLKQGNLQKAVALSKDIEDFTLTCGDNMGAWLRMKKHFMHYYMRRREFDKALVYCRTMERNLQGEAEYERWDDFLACYAYSDLGKALKIYKEHWKEWLNWRDPSDEFHCCMNVCLFLRELGRSREEEGQDNGADLSAEDSSADKVCQKADAVVRLSLDDTFPLYQESGVYSIGKLYEFYFQRAEELAAKFDARNGADGYRKELEEALCMTR